MSDPVLERRSIRKYTAQPVPDELVETLLRAAMSAPSAGNAQPWHFVIIRERTILDAVGSFHPYARMINKAPVAILVCADHPVRAAPGRVPGGGQAAVAALRRGAYPPRPLAGARRGDSLPRRPRGKDGSDP